MAASLYALELPPRGGDTLFCDTVAAYQALPSDIKVQISQLKSINSSSKSAVAKTRVNRINNKALAKKIFSNAHPVVRIHPETKNKILYVNETHSTHFEGQNEQQSEALLNVLFEHARKPQFQCRIKWHLGMVVLWDNRSTHHYPINDYTGYRRLLHRVFLKDDQPI
ncbi:MAG: hypothetical protein COB26_09700 [Piscirickettsiaceae bacterium]|nr:MAG: hypothetical protein COB26_09700 [Piscirickettsiaceae bacterium]